MSDLLAEVDEAMRMERLEKLWKMHSRKFIAAFVLILVLTAGISGYKHWDSRVKQKDTSMLLSLLNDPSFPENINPDTLDLRPGLRGVALVTAAGSYMTQGKTEEAATLYHAAASDTAIPDDLQHMAVIMHVRLSKAESDMQDELLQDLKPITRDSSSPWRYHAHLETASLYAHHKNDFEKARAELKPVMEAKDVSPTLKTQANVLDHVYALKQAEQKS